MFDTKPDKLIWFRIYPSQWAKRQFPPGWKGCSSHDFDPPLHTPTRYKGKIRIYDTKDKDSWEDYTYDPQFEYEFEFQAEALQDPLTDQIFIPQDKKPQHWNVSPCAIKRYQAKPKRTARRDRYGRTRGSGGCFFDNQRVTRSKAGMRESRAVRRLRPY